MKNLKWPILIVLSLVWGSSFILMKRGLEAFSSSQVAALRISLAWLFLLPFMLRHYKLNLKKYALPIIGMGTFGNLIPAFLFTAAETGISSSLTGMLNALTPLFTVVLGLFIFRNRTNWFQAMGIVVGLVGALMLLYNDREEESSQIRFALLVVIATVCYALSVNIIRKFLGDLNSVTATVWAFTFTGPLAATYLLTTDFFDVLTVHPKALQALGYTAILGIVGSALSVIAFNELIKMSNAVFASTTTYLIPIVAVFWGLTDGETISWLQVLAMVVILAAVWLVNFQRGPRT